MAERNQRFYRLLFLPAVYECIQNLVGVSRLRKKLYEDYISRSTYQNVLDIGCGTAQMLSVLGGIRYTGIDNNRAYLKQAHRKFGTMATFHCEDLTISDLGGRENVFDLVLGVGVLHHLDDAQALTVIANSYYVLKEGGGFLTIDPVLIKRPQNKIARWLIKNDRGKNVRDENETRRLGLSVFVKTNVNVHNDYLRIPYTHVVMECRK